MGYDITDTAQFPVYATKAAFLADLALASRNGDENRLWQIIHRLSNTDTDNWTGDSTARTLE